MSGPALVTVTLSLPADADMALLYGHLCCFAEHQKLGVSVMPNGLDMHLRPVAGERPVAQVIPFARLPARPA